LPKKRTQVAKSQGVPHSAHPVTRTLTGAPSSARVSPRCSSDTVIRFWHGMWGQLAAVAFSRLVSPRLQTLLWLQPTARASEPRQLAPQLRQLAPQSHGSSRLKATAPDSPAPQCRGIPRHRAAAPQLSLELATSSVDTSTCTPRPHPWLPEPTSMPRP